VTEYKKIHGKSFENIKIGQLTAFMHERAVEGNVAALRNQHKQKSTMAINSHHKSLRTANHYKGSQSRERSHNKGGNEKSSSRVRA
jgi:hypothetical protein